MVHQNSVSLEEMRSSLITVDQLREELSATEPLTEIPFEAGGAELRLEADWGGDGVALTSPTSAYLLLPGGSEFQLTKQAALEVGAAVGIPRKVQTSSDPDLMAGLVNWRLREVLDSRELKALGRDGSVLALTRGTVSPFSNLAMLDTILEGLAKKYGSGERLVDHKRHNDLEHTGFRVVVPGSERVITGTSVADDTWAAGINFANSLIGLRQLRIDGYLFRYWCTNGSIDTLHSVGGLSRRGTTQEDALAWAAETVEEVLGGLEPMLDHVQELTAQPVAGNVRDTLDGLFQDHGIPSRSRYGIIEAMAEDEEMTMYSLMQAVTMAANLDGLDDRDRIRLMSMGGSIAGSHSQRCSLGRVHRVVVPGEVEDEPAEA